MLETQNLAYTLGGSMQAFLEEFFLVRLELVPVLNGLTWNWTFTYSRTIPAPGLVLLRIRKANILLLQIWADVPSAYNALKFLKFIYCFNKFSNMLEEIKVSFLKLAHFFSMNIEMIGRAKFIWLLIGWEVVEWSQITIL